MCQPNNALEISLLDSAPATVGQYMKYEISFTLSRSYENPFDPREISVESVFTDASGKDMIVPAFWFQDIVSAGEPSLTGPTLWKIRFAPQTTGNYTAKIRAKDKTATCELPLPSFQVSQSDSKGFIHCTSAKPGRFQFDSGGMFFPIGEVLWMCYAKYPPNPLEYFKKSIDEFEGFGLNYFRFFVGVDSGFPIRNVKAGPERFDLAASRRLDLFFDLVGEHGCYVNMGLDIWNEVRAIPPFEKWNLHPYNAENGGPCRTPGEYYTNDEAKRLYKNLLRYIVARWGYSPNLFLIQLLAEADYTEGYEVDPARIWHAEMGAYFDSIDPYGHLFSSSLAVWRRDPKFFTVPGLDVTLPEIYDIRDMGEGMYTEQVRCLEKYQKPCLVAEAGLSYLYNADDEKGIHVHNSLWGSTMSGAAGCPSFWMASYIHEKGLLSHFRAVSRFVKDENFIGLRPLTASRIEYRDGNNAGVCANVSLPIIVHFMFADSGSADPRGPQTIAVPNDSITSEFPNMPRIFYSKNGSDKVNYNPVTLDVDFASDGEFVFYAYWLADEGEAAVVSVLVDGEERGPVRIATAKGWTDRTEVYQRDCRPHAFKIPQGKHRIVVSNEGDAWAELRMDLFNYAKPDIPNMSVFGMGNDSKAYLWMHNRDNTWFWDWDVLHREPRTIQETRVTLEGFVPGKYAVEWWDTYSGEVLNRETSDVEGANRPLILNVPRIERDVVCKIKKTSTPS